MKSFFARIEKLEKAGNPPPALPLPIITIKGDPRAWVKGVEFPTMKAAQKAHPAAAAIFRVSTMNQARVIMDLLSGERGNQGNGLDADLAALEYEQPDGEVDHGY